MINKAIREFEDKVIEVFNSYQLEPEIKRLVAQNVLDKITRMADAKIVEEIKEVKEDGIRGIQSDNMEE